MPQLKSPDTLFNLSLSKTRLLIKKHGSNIWYTFRNFNASGCQGAIRYFNQYLNSCFPPHIVDELYNSATIFYDDESENSPWPSEEMVTEDLRIVLSLYINKNMKTFTAHKLVNDDFWKSTLPSLEKLSSLDLSKVCTDEILEVVGKHCKNLEFINIVSKSCQARTKDRHNALKLQLFVSDAGLDFLSNCKRLKEIQMTCIIRKGCGGRQITNEGIKRLLLALPELKRINFTDTGLLFDSIPADIDKLSLVSIVDFHPEPSRIFKIELLCPFLTELYLTNPFLANDNGSNVISALCCSGLNISTLSLTNFPFDDGLKNYLEVKGSQLRDFSFITSIIQSVSELLRILGWTCPNLESILVRSQVFHLDLMNNQLPFNTSFDDINEKHFCNLRNFIISGVYWNSRQVLPLLLKKAEFIEQIDLSYYNYTDCLDETLQLIQQTNPFLHLKTVVFMKGVNVSFNFLKSFIMSCPVLKNVIVENNSQAYCDLLDGLRQELLSKNFDVNIDIYRM